MKTRTRIGLLLCLALVFCLVFASSSIAASVGEDVLQVEIDWCKALKKVDTELMSSLYWNSTKTQMYSPNVFSEDWRKLANRP